MHPHLNHQPIRDRQPDPPHYVAYDPEIGLWAVMTPDGFVKSYEATSKKAEAVCAGLNRQ